MKNAAQFVIDDSRGILGKPDSEDMWVEITGKLPDEVLLKPNAKFLNIGCGHCTEAVILAKRMIALGFTREEALDRIHVLDKYVPFTNIARRIGFTNVHTADFLEWKTDMKFAAIIGNPPYQDPSSPTLKIWEQFLARSFEVCEDGGWVALIHPLNWMSNKDNMFKKFFKDKNPTVLNIGACQHYFPGIMTKIGYNIIQNSPSPKGSVVEINTPGRTFTLDITQYDFLPLNLTPPSVSILNKTVGSATKTLSFTRSSETGTAKIVRDTPTTTHAFPVFRGANKQGVLWGFSQHPHALQGVWKVVFQEFSTDNKGVFVLQEAATENGYMMTVESEPHAHVLRSVLLSNVYQFLLTSIKTSRTIRPHMLNRLPLVDLTRSWTDEELYAHFNLTQEEIDLIESTVK